MNLPNAITLARIFLVPLLVVVLLTKFEGRLVLGVRKELVGAAIFGIAALTDVLDGYLARRDNHVTAFGRIADPFVDKVLVIGAMVFLAVMPWSRHWFPAWVVVVIIAREFLITGLRGYVESMGAEFPSDWLGKVKMFTQCIAVGVVVGLFAFEWSNEAFAFWATVGRIFVWATLLISLGSCASYLVKTRRIVLETAP